MRQKSSVNVADITMNIVCEETPETIDTAAKALNTQIQALTTAQGHSCTRTEAALLAALDHITRAIHLEERVKELEDRLEKLLEGYDLT